jgi:hypothetical protein
LQQGAAFVSPVGLQRENDLLESEHKTVVLKPSKARRAAPKAVTRHVASKRLFYAAQRCQ